MRRSDSGGEGADILHVDWFMQKHSTEAPFNRWDRPLQLAFALAADYRQKSAQYSAICNEDDDHGDAEDDAYDGSVYI